jgi:hypothetical protein
MNCQKYGQSFNVSFVYRKQKLSLKKVGCFKKRRSQLFLIHNAKCALFSKRQLGILFEQNGFDALQKLAAQVCSFEEQQWFC